MIVAIAATDYSVDVSIGKLGKYLHIHTACKVEEIQALTQAMLSENMLCQTTEKNKYVFCSLLLDISELEDFISI